MDVEQLTTDVMRDGDQTVAENFDLLAWIDTGAIASREVTIWIDHAAYQRAVAAAESLAELDDGDVDGADRPMHAPASQRAALQAELDAANAELAKSAMTWTVRAISAETAVEAAEAVPGPKPLAPLPEGISQKQREQYMAEKVTPHTKAVAAANIERQLWVLARAVESVATPAGTQYGVTVDELRALRARPHGAAWITKLYEAVNAASSEEAVPPFPTLPTRSTNIPL